MKINQQIEKINSKARGHKIYKTEQKSSREIKSSRGTTKADMTQTQLPS